MRLLTGPGWGILNTLLDGQRLTIGPDAFCRLTIFFEYWLKWTPVWCLVIITLERALAILFPHKVQLWVTNMRIGLCTSIVSFLLFVTSLLQAIFSKYRYGNRTCLDKNIAYVVMSTDLVLGFIFPYTFIILGNGLIIVTMFRNQARSRLGHTSSRQPHRLQLTITLVIVSVAFLLLTIPTIVFDYIPNEVRLNSRQEMLYDLARGFFISELVKVLDYLNNGINFWIYCVTGRQFRKKLAKKLHLPCVHE